MGLPDHELTPSPALEPAPIEDLEPEATGPTPAPEPEPAGIYPTPAPAPSPSCSPEGHQCAGPGWEGPTCCTSGNKCLWQNEYWSKCVPESTSSCASSGQQC